MTTINLLFGLGLCLVTALLEGGGRLEELEDVVLVAEEVTDVRDNVADDAVLSLVEKMFTEDKDNVCGCDNDDNDEDVSPLSLSPVSVTWKNKLLEAV